MWQQNPEGEFAEMVANWCGRGLSLEVAEKFAVDLTWNGALEAYLRGEVGLIDLHSASPKLAALVSGFAFAIAATLPFAATAFAPAELLVHAVLIVTPVALTALGGTGARIGGPPEPPAMLRTVVCCPNSMTATFLVGSLVGGYFGQL